MMSPAQIDILKNTLVILLAGGQGERLYPLTKDRAKPAVPFAGSYRIIDFTLSNVVNSGLRKIDVLTQYKSYSLQRHLQLGWNIFNWDLGEYLNVIPPQQRMTSMWYRGTADALFQNIYILEKVRPRYVLIVSGDHIYKMDYAKLIGYHVQKAADLTVACMQVRRSEAHRFGIMQVDDKNRIVDFEEKPAAPRHMPGRPDVFLGSMGVYVFNTEELVRQVIADSKVDTAHDFGKNIIPGMIAGHDVFMYNFSQGAAGRPYWRDIGTLDAYWQASMDLLGAQPSFELSDSTWPLRTYHPQHPPARIISTQNTRDGMAVNSLISAGTTINNARVADSIISPRVNIEPGACIESSVIMHGTTIGAGARIRNAIIDKDVTVPPGTEIGFDAEKDRRHFTVTDSGLVVIPKEQPFAQRAEAIV
jgi:glucose-1-phosphate adenylyltransferase